MHGLTGGGWKRSDLATVTAVKRPAGETRGKLAAGPNARQRHRASPRPYTGISHARQTHDLREHPKIRLTLVFLSAHRSAEISVPSRIREEPC